MKVSKHIKIDWLYGRENSAKEMLSACLAVSAYVWRYIIAGHGVTGENNKQPVAYGDIAQHLRKMPICHIIIWQAWKYIIWRIAMKKACVA